MTGDDFVSQLEDAVRQAGGAAPAFAGVPGRLRDTAAAVTRRLAAGDLELRVEPGFQAGIGQQRSIVTVSPSRNYRDALFREYVPVTGCPVQLDLLGEDLVPCNSLGELSDQILQFPKMGDVQARLQVLADIAKG